MPPTPEDAASLLRRLAAETGGPGLPDAELIIPQAAGPRDRQTLVPLVGMHLQLPENGLAVIDNREPAHLDYAGIYLTLREYWPPELLPDEVEDSLLQSFADQARRPSMIENLAAVNEISKRPDGTTLLEDLFSAAMTSDLQARFKAALALDRGGLGVQIVGPQPLLLSLRWLIGRPPVSEPVEDPESDETVRRAITFSHLIGARIRNDPGEHQEAEKSDLELALVLGGLGAIGSDRDVYSSIDRTIRLWREYGVLAEELLGQSANDLFEVNCGVEPEDVVAVGFGLMGHVMGWEPGRAYVIDRQLHEHAPQEVCQAVIGMIGLDLEEAQQHQGDPQSEFDWLTIESTPVLIEPRGLVVLDRHLLWSRCTTGLYWFLHDALKTSAGEEVCQRWRIAHGAMIEALAEDSLKPLAPEVLGDKDGTFYTEDDFAVAYGSGTKRCDVGIDFGADFLLVEIVSGQLTVPSRIGGDLEKLATDFDKLIIEKCEQLDSIALKLIDDERQLTDTKRSEPMRIVPAVVVGGGLPVNVATYRYIRRRLDEEGLLTHTRVEPLAIIDLEDVETLEGLHEHYGRTPTQVLKHWQASDHANLPLRNYLSRYEADPPVLPIRMTATVEATFEDVLRRLRLGPFAPED